MFLGNLLDKQARLIPNRLAVSDERARVTYKQLAGRVNQLAGALKDKGIQKGDRVAILHRNCIEYVEVYFAIMKLGAIVVPINFRLVTREIEFFLRDAEPKAILVGVDYVDRITPLMANNLGVELWICIHGECDHFIEYESFLVRQSSKPIDMNIDDNDTAAIIYTGGTTGTPKGAMHTHRSLSAGIDSIWISRLSQEDVALFPIPLFHIGIVQVFWCLLAGARIHLLSYFPDKVETFLKIIESEGITFGGTLPAIMTRIANMDPEIAEKYDLSTYRLASIGAAPHSVTKLRQGLEILGCSVVWTAAGMTECPFYSSSIIEYQENDEILSSAGKEGMLDWIKIVDENGKEVPEGQSGELIVKSEKTMKGYWRNPQLTEETIKNGWLYTGDICKVDEDRYIYFMDRKKDMIISGGENIYSLEVEDVLHMHPDIAEAAVVGVDDEKWGEVPLASVVLKKGKILAMEDIKEFCIQNLAKYKVPKHIEFCEDLPRTPMGKVQKNVLREKFVKENSNYVN